MFMTNNSSKSVNAYIEKLHKLGIEATKEDFITSSQATAFYLKKHHKDARLYVCGTQSLKEELVTEGFMVTEKDIMDIQRAADMNDPYLMAAVRNVYNDAENK